MDQVQLERWQQLSAGLARSYTTLTPRRREKLLVEIDNCIDYVVCNGLDTVADWDDGVRYGAASHESYGSAGNRVSEFLWDNRYEFDRQYRNGEAEPKRGRFGDMLAACVRAGFDVAVAPSGGVVGFTVGDLRGIFDGAIPDWVASHFDDPAALPAAGADEGVWL